MKVTVAFEIEIEEKQLAVWGRNQTIELVVEEADRSVRFMANRLAGLLDSKAKVEVDASTGPEFIRVN